tara:strand:+ start:4343 stop:4708 length:366 start_codon:yes stop_codon:yes gene_type:complete
MYEKETCHKARKGDKESIALILLEAPDMPKEMKMRPEDYAMKMIDDAMHMDHETMHMSDKGYEVKMDGSKKTMKIPAPEGFHFMMYKDGPVLMLGEDVEHEGAAGEIEIEVVEEHDASRLM